MLDKLGLFSFHGREMEFLVRLLLAVLAGGLVGMEREFRGRPAGLRTHILVALGSAIISLVSLELANLVNVKSADYAVRMDVSRIAAGMVTGIGFLGAGTIIKMGRTVRGLTTAASVWCVASIGMGFGFGFYLLSLLGAVLMLITLMVVPRLEKGMTRDWYTHVVVRIHGNSDRVKELRRLFMERGWRVVDIEMRKNKSRDIFEAKFEMRLQDKSQTDEVGKILEAAEYVSSYRIA